MSIQVKLSRKFRPTDGKYNHTEEHQLSDTLVTHPKHGLEIQIVENRGRKKQQ